MLVHVLVLVLLLPNPPNPIYNHPIVTKPFETNLPSAPTINRSSLPAACAYGFTVATCLFFAFDFSGAISPNWTFALFLLTLPWSLLTLPFVWSLIHGANLAFFAIVFLAGGAVNALVIYRLARRLEERRKG